MKYRIRQLLTPERTLALSFAFLIFAGSLLLLLPQATHGDKLNVVDAIFTATSATCVTGLVVVDTGTTFTLFGQIVILLMIQLGGLGIITFSTAFLYMLEGRLGLGSRDLLFETLSQGPTPDIKNLLKTVFFSTLFIEAIGALVLLTRFLGSMPFIKALYFSIFHSISAFCNAGFSLYSDSLESFKGDLWVNAIISSLIVLGGVGFIVIHELPKLAKGFRHRVSFHAKLVLSMTIILIVCGSACLFLLEIKNSSIDIPWHTKLLTSVFQSITARTAGFNTINLQVLSNPSLFILILLMFIGASPASCGGGIKVTTTAVLSALFVARFRNQDNTNLFSRRIPNDSIAKAISVASFSIVCITIGLVLLLFTELSGISHQESRGLFLELLFEATSAFATVGLSIGTTPTLSFQGRLIIIALMFIGRLGPVTIAMTVGRKNKARFKFAEEKVLVG